MHLFFVFIIYALLDGFISLRRISRQDYETLFHIVILSKHHHHQYVLVLTYHNNNATCIDDIYHVKSLLQKARNNKTLG
jgi:hypothetical protein